jgi:hypothetical protein
MNTTERASGIVNVENNFLHKLPNVFDVRTISNVEQVVQFESFFNTAEKARHLRGLAFKQQILLYCASTQSSCNDQGMFGGFCDRLNW